MTAEQADRLGNLIRLSYEPMFVWRLDGPIEFWNAGAERLYGFTPDEAIGRSSHSLLQTKFPVEFAELRSQLENDGHWSGELRHVCKDGREVVVDSRTQLLGGETVLEANRDITEIKQLADRQAALSRDHLAAAAKFGAVFNQSAIFESILDVQGYLRETNDLSLRLCGYARDDVLDRLFWDTPWWRGSEQAKARVRFAAGQAASGVAFREELPYWVADGGERIVDFAMHPIRDPLGAVMFLHSSGSTSPSVSGSKRHFAKKKSKCGGWRQLSTLATMRS